MYNAKELKEMLSTINGLKTLEALYIELDLPAATNLLQSPDLLRLIAQAACLLVPVYSPEKEVLNSVSKSEHNDNNLEIIEALKKLLLATRKSTEGCWGEIYTVLNLEEMTLSNAISNNASGSNQKNSLAIIENHFVFETLHDKLFGKQNQKVRDLALEEKMRKEREETRRKQLELAKLQIKNNSNSMSSSSTSNTTGPTGNATAFPVTLSNELPKNNNDENLQSSLVNNNSNNNGPKKEGKKLPFDDADLGQELVVLKIKSNQS